MSGSPDLPELTEAELDADGDGTVTKTDMQLLNERGVPVQSIQVALDRLAARLTEPEQVDALQELRAAIESPADAQNPAFGGALILGLVGML